MENIQTMNYTLLPPADGVALEPDGVFGVSAAVWFLTGDPIGEWKGSYSSFPCCVAFCRSCSSRSCVIISS